MKKIFLISFLFQTFCLAQIPSLVHTPDKALENVEASSLEASDEKKERLFSCKFNKDDEDYKITFSTTGQNDIVTVLAKKHSTYSYTAGKSLHSYKPQATLHDYSSQSYNHFVNNLVVNFLNNSHAQANMNFNSYCPDESGHISTKWTDSSNIEFEEAEIHIQLRASAKKRSFLSHCMAEIGCALSEGWELTSQSYRFLNKAESFDDWSTRLAISQLLAPRSISAAAKYDEELKGTITIDSEDYELECGDEFLPHYYK